jgi:hypothetical protein
LKVKVQIGRRYLKDLCGDNMMKVKVKIWRRYLKDLCGDNMFMFFLKRIYMEVS